ncbi:hypothetical protein EV356DRAFT_576908 [Viridothelium virens]|uniref:SnoaL-like domain-containing protein n=1 Tax=Viridothelium virens TaxID=1048519 RepID=A0A6A6H810_VIRVR|nr:hypothetical protein EV356DRAFT_576908 [Viridothelium virens]
MTSSETYSMQQYLLDRAQIHDTLTRMYYAVDSQQYSLLSSHVLAPTVTMDYTAMFGGEPIQRTAQAQQANWTELMQKMDVTQHILTSILPELPSPGPEASVPNKANAVVNVTAYLRKKLINGEVRETRNGGRGEFELLRIPELAEKAGGNPWRVSKLKVFPVWDQGGKEFWGAE